MRSIGGCDLQIYECLRVFKRPRKLDLAQQIPITVDGRITGRNHRSILIQRRRQWHNGRQRCGDGSFERLHGELERLPSSSPGNHSQAQTSDPMGSLSKRSPAMVPHGAQRNLVITRGKKLRRWRDKT
jgi:hypothetical protein